MNHVPPIAWTALVPDSAALAAAHSAELRVLRFVGLLALRALSPPASLSQARSVSS